MNHLAAVNEKHDPGTEQMQLVSFCLNDEIYGIEVLKVREIIRLVNITCTPNSPHWVEGIINLRGKVIPIISMRKRFGLPEADNDNQSRVIIMDICGELLGFTVDAVSEVIRISGREVQPPPQLATGGIGQEFLAGVVNRGDKLLILLDLDRIFSRDEQYQLGQC